MEENLRGLLKSFESFTEEEYKNSSCMSYSVFKDIYDNPNLLLEPKEEKKEEWFVFGTMVDMMLTENADVVNEAIIVNDEVPTEQFKAIADYIIENDLTIADMTDSQIDEAYVASGSKVNWGIPVKRQKIIDNCEKYITFRKESKDKIVVSSDLFNEAVMISNVFLTHRWSRDLFMSDIEQKANNVEILYQYRIKYMLRDILFKSKLDVVVIDHENKKIYPYDIKTGSDSPRNFLVSSVYRYKYLYQAALYRQGLETFVHSIPQFADYVVEDFRFVYVSRTNPAYPVILHISDEMEESFMLYGLFSDRYYIPAVFDVIHALKSYLARISAGDTVLEPYDLYKYNGEFTLEEHEFNLSSYYR